MTDFFNPKVMKSVETQRQKMKENIEAFQKAREILSEDQLEDIKTEFQTHYLEQLQKPVNEREVFEKDGVHYVVFQTPDKEFEFASGDTNRPKKNKDDVNWNMNVDFPLMTPDDASFPNRMKLFISNELLEDIFKEDGYWKMLVGARGRFIIKYHNMADCSIELNGEDITIPKAQYAEILAKFLKRNYIDDLSQIDESDYVKRYTFNLSQVLDKVKLK